MKERTAKIHKLSRGSFTSRYSRIHEDRVKDEISPRELGIMDDKIISLPTYHHIFPKLKLSVHCRFVGANHRSSDSLMFNCMLPFKQLQISATITFTSCEITNAAGTVPNLGE